MKSDKTKLARERAEFNKAISEFHEELLARGFHLRRHKGSRDHPFADSAKASNRILDVVLGDINHTEEA